MPAARPPGRPLGRRPAVLGLRQARDALDPVAPVAVFEDKRAFERNDVVRPGRRDRPANRARFGRLRGAAFYPNSRDGYQMTATIRSNMTYRNAKPPAA